MTYFDKASKDQLREYQKLSTLSKHTNYAMKYAEALAIFQKTKDIADVVARFNVSKVIAYRMVRKGRNA